MLKNYCTIALNSHDSKVMLKTLRLGFSSMWTKNFQMYKLDLEKAEEQIANIHCIMEQENSRKTSTSLTVLKPRMCGLQQTVENS